ncbi:MAG: hypothetical protein WCV81_01555 [Microgenomates group bacterium]|jgi:hypothetical protein
MTKIKSLFKKAFSKADLIWTFVGSVPLFIIALFLFRFAPNIQFIIFFVATVFYLLVALTHHFRHKTLILEIVIEYILIAALALIIVQSLIL